MFTVRVKRKTFKKLPAKIVGPKRVKVGFPAGEADSDNISKAVWNEFGTSGGGWGGPIPERPFMRNAMRNHRNVYAAGMKASAAKLLIGDTTLLSLMGKLGALAQGHIQKEISSLSSPPNSPVTVERKGSSKPLIDTGEMRQAVTWKIDE